MSSTYPLASQGVFATIQGEGRMLGVPTIFVRLAGCSVGCPECDTDYSVSRRATAREIAQECVNAQTKEKWVWLTGGEPTDHDCAELVLELHRAGFWVAMATSGHRTNTRGWSDWPFGVDFLSVSPHSPDPDVWTQAMGNQLNLVPGLNRCELAEFEEILRVREAGFPYKTVTPCDGKPETVSQCVDWVQRHPDWRLGVQAHKIWGVN